jgi:thymidylate synthase ThyX
MSSELCMVAFNTTIEVVASTNNIKKKSEVFDFARACGRVCYSEHDFESITAEQDKNNLIGRLLDSGHHSPFDQVDFNLYFKGLPKFGAMILNNEKVYATSEKSARYTQMKVEGREKELFDKWFGIFKNEIKEQYPQLDDVKIGKLAQENARYLTSVFTPTKMVHKISFRQLNYFAHWFNDFIRNEDDTPFNRQVKTFMKQFVNDPFVQEMYEERLDPAMKKRKLSMFSKRDVVHTEFGENYSTLYLASYAYLAQGHRHRTLKYSITRQDENLGFFVPPILRENNRMDEWERDIRSVKNEFPQGSLIAIHETGNYEDFISKLNERRCGNAQWEIMNQSGNTLKSYLEHCSDSTIYNELIEYSEGARCTFPGVKCVEPCAFGPSLGIERLV